MLNPQVIEAVSQMQNYAGTYTAQHGYDSYQTFTYVEDILYGLAISLNKDKYQFAQGYALFRQDLLKFIAGDAHIFDRLSEKA